MAAMAPALTDAPAEARHIRLKLAAESNGNSTNLLLSSSVSPTNTAGVNKRRHIEDSCQRCCNGKDSLPEPLGLSKLQPLVASYLCSHVAPVAEEGALINTTLLKSRSVLNGDLFLHKALNRGQLKGLVNGGGSAMVPVNGLAKKAAVPCTALPEKGSVATVNGDNAKPPNSTGDLPLSSKSDLVVPTLSGLRGDSKNLSKQDDLLSQALDGTGLVPSLSASSVVKSEMPISARSRCGRVQALKETNIPNIEQHVHQKLDVRIRTSSPSSEVQPLLLHERVQQSCFRQADISVRLHRLCTRLQVVQAKQVERHVRQQVSGFLHHSSTVASNQDYVAQLLRGTSVPSELENLHLSGTTSLRTAEAQFDSDATESSSGGESDVEEDELARVDIEQRHVSLWRRAEGRFALERAAIISRWTWLQAHISDLEYRIRQHTDIYQQIHASKGAVELEKSFPSDPTQVAKAEFQIAQNGTGDPPSKRQHDPAVNGFLQNSNEGLDAKTSLAPDNGCSAARVRPLVSCKRRHLIQPSTLQHLNSKVHRVCFSPRKQCEVNAFCVMCMDTWTLPKPEQIFELPLVERVAMQDSSIHPKLSLQSEVSLSLHLQRVLKSQWQTRWMEKVKPRKKPLFKQKLYSSMLLKHKFRFSNSRISAIRMLSHRNRTERLQKHQTEGGIHLPELDTYTPCRSGRLLDRSLSRKRAREHSLDRLEFPKLQIDTGSACLSQSSIQPSTPSILSRQMGLPSDSSTPLTPSSQMGSCSMPIRKRRSENSFDINNIVIPMSVAATTRVEKLQYKEIITPSWREVDVLSQIFVDEEANVEVEDLSDAAFLQLHQKCEKQERSRWRLTAIAPAKRKGSRLYKSIGGKMIPSLGGTNPFTSQPPSPDTGHFHLLQDYGPVPSPLSPPSPDTPCSRDAHTPNSRDSHTHYLRETHRPVYNEDTCCSMPDCTYEERIVQPWERRSFPLSEDPELEHKVKPRPHQRFCYRAESESDASSP